MAGKKQGKTRVRLSYKDFQPLGNSAKQYISPSTGEIISNYAYRKNAVRTPIKSSKKSSNKSSTKKIRYTNIKPPKTIKTRSTSKLHKIKSELRKKANRENYQDKVRRYMNRQNRLADELGLSKMTYNEVRSNPDFRRLYYNLTHSQDNSLRGEIHEALVDFDYRDPEADYLPGETP